MRLFFVVALCACSWPEHRYREVGIVEDTANLPPPTACPPESERQAPCDELREFQGRYEIDGEGSEFCRTLTTGKLSSPARPFGRATVRAALSVEGVHVFVHVADDRAVVDRADPVRGDAIEIFVRGSHDRTLTGALDADEAHHLVLTPPTAEAEGVGLRYLNRKPLAPINDAQWHSRRVRDGWEVELHYPWTVLGNQPSPGEVMGFDVALDRDDGPRTVMFLAPVAGSCGDPACDDRTWCLVKAYVP